MIPSQIKEYREGFLGGGSCALAFSTMYPGTPVWVNDLYYNLYCFWTQLQNNSDSLTNRILELKDTKLIIVYRDPYEAFTSAITTAAQTSNFLDKNNICSDNDILNDKNEILNTIMLNSGHFTFFLWRIILATLENVDCQNNIEFVELKDLSTCIQLELLTYSPHTKKHYNFDVKETNILNLSKEQLIKECKKSNKKLWDKMMVEIELDKIALNTLINKYKVFKI